MIFKYTICFFLFHLIFAQAALKGKNNLNQVSENEVHFGSKISKSFLEDIKIGYEEQNQKKEELGQREKELNSREKILKERMEELEKIHKENLALLKQIEKQKNVERQEIKNRKQNIEKLIEAFSNSNMEPKIKVEKLLDLLDSDEQSAIEIMRKMPVKQLAQVLNLPESAPLSRLMAGNSKMLKISGAR